MAGLKITCAECGQINRVPTDRVAAGPKCAVCGTPLNDGKVREVDSSWLEKAARTDDLPLVVDFWAPWCGPCRMMAPEFSKAADEMKGRARLVKLNTQTHPDASARYNIRGIPMMAVFRGGKERARQAGAIPAPSIVQWVQSAI